VITSSGHPFLIINYNPKICPMMCPKLILVMTKKGTLIDNLKSIL